MTIWIALGLVLLVGAFVCMFWAGREDRLEVVFLSAVLLIVGLVPIMGDIGDNNRGYASNSCETGTYRLSTFDNSNDTNLYITVRDYKDYTLRLCSIKKKNVHASFSYSADKVVQPKNVKLTVESDLLHLYPAD